MFITHIYSKSYQHLNVNYTQATSNHLKANLGSVQFKGYLRSLVFTIRTKNPANRVQPPQKDQEWKHKRFTVQREKCSLSKASNATLDPQDPDTCGASATTEPKQLGTDFFRKEGKFQVMNFQFKLTALCAVSVKLEHYQSPNTQRIYYECHQQWMNCCVSIQMLQTIVTPGGGSHSIS